MAKPSSVYSILGMKTPEQVAQEEREKAFEYFAGQRTGYEKAGAGLGLLLGSLFGGESDDMARSREGMEIIQSARAEADNQRAMLAEAEAQATAREQAEVDARYQRAQAAAGTESVVDEAPTVQQTPLSPEQQLMNEYQIRYENFTKIADALEQKGFLEEAENARAVAREAAKGILETEADMASIALTKAKTEAEGVVDPKDYKNVGTYIDNETGEKFVGGRIPNTRVFMNFMTGQVVSNVSQFQPGSGTPTSMADINITSAFLSSDSDYDGLSASDKAQLATDITAEVDRRMRDQSSKGIQVNQADIIREVYNEMKQQGVIEKKPWWQTFGGLFGDPTKLRQQPSPSNMAQHQAANAKAKAAGQTTYTLNGQKFKVQ